MALFPYDLSNLLGGKVRILYTPVVGGAAVPAGPKDIFDQESPYASGASWVDFGATSAPSSYERGLDLTGWEIEQSDAAVVEQVSSQTRRVSVPMAELNQAAFKIFENASSVGTVAATTGQGAQKKIGMGLIQSLARYRIAFVSMRDQSAGQVTETAGAVPPSGKRGRFVVGVGWEAAITADAVALEQAKAAMSSVTVTFNFYPVGETSGEEFGAWWLEDAGALT